MKRQERSVQSKIDKKNDLFRLAEHGSVSEMEAALQEGIRLDTLDVAYSRTALMVAAASNSEDVVRALLNSIADPKIDLRITSPVRPTEMPPPPQQTRKAVAPFSSRPLGTRGAGWLHGAALGCDEQPRRQGCAGGQTAAPVARRRVASEQGRRLGARPRGAVRESRVGGYSCCRIALGKGSVALNPDGSLFGQVWC